MILGLVAIGLLVPACKEVEASEDSAYQEPSTLVAIDGSDVSQVILTAKAAERIGLETVPVDEAADGLTIIPHAAVFYGLNGETWTYTSPEPLTFVRAPITVEAIDADLAYLSEGPATGTAVVTVGAAELFGVESGVGH
jgi:hypothetical protein